MFILTTCVTLAKMNKIDPFSVQCTLSRRLSWSERPQQMKLSSLSQLPCKIMAVLLHFFFLCAFAWMLVEGLHLYSMVVKVFGSEGSKHFYYYAIGWGEYNILQTGSERKVWRMQQTTTICHTLLALYGITDSCAYT